MQTKVTPQTLETALVLAYRLGFLHARQNLATKADTLERGTVAGLCLMFPVHDAAPELLEALMGMLEWARRVKGLNPGPEIVQAMNAIARAAGPEEQPMKEKRPAGYVRVPAEEPGAGVSLRMQEVEIRAWADLYGYKLVRVAAGPEEQP